MHPFSPADPHCSIVSGADSVVGCCSIIHLDDLQALIIDFSASLDSLLSVNAEVYSRHPGNYGTSLSGQMSFSS